MDTSPVTVQVRDWCRRWAQRHDDVTPSVGLALLSLSAPTSRIAAVAQASLSTQQPEGLWKSYWWSSPWYATWLNLSWLNRCGHATDALRRKARASLHHLQGQLTALDLACVLGVLWESCQDPDDPAVFAVSQRLLQLQHPCGRFPASAALLLPSQHSATRTDGPYADTRGIVTTAIALMVMASSGERRPLSGGGSSEAGGGRTSSSPRSPAAR